MYRIWVGDESDDPHFVAAGRTDIDLEFEHGLNHAKRNGRSPWSCMITDLSTGRSEAEIPSKCSGQQRGPYQSVFGGACFLSFVHRIVLPVVFIVAGRNDFRSLLGIRREDPVVSGGMGPGWGYYRG